MNTRTRRRVTTLSLLATIQVQGLEVEYVAARRRHRFRSTRWIAACVIRNAANDQIRARPSSIDLRRPSVPADLRSWQRSSDGTPGK